MSYLDPRGCVPDCYVSNVPQPMSGPGPTSTPRRMPTVETPPTTEVEVSSATLPTVSSAQSVDPQPRMREPSPAVRAVQARPQREEYLADVNNPETWIPEDPYWQGSKCAVSRIPEEFNIHGGKSTNLLTFPLGKVSK